MISVQIYSVPFVFQERVITEKGNIVGYVALINSFKLDMPYPAKWALISTQNKKNSTSEWQVFPSKYLPKENLYQQLVFALKYEGINLLFFKKIFQNISQEEILKLISFEPSGIYCRKIWFLYEFLMEQLLPINNADAKIKYTDLIEENKQFALQSGIKSSRHRIVNNLPGTVNFCPLIFKTEKLTKYIKADLAEKNNVQIRKIHKDILARTSAFLLLKDSKASFNIEGENPIPSRAMRWGKAINQAGKNSLTKEELERLQQIVIENSKFLKYGFRKQDGFVGEHDRDTHQPIPEHISAKHTDVELLMNGLINTSNVLIETQYHPVLSAAAIAFGFVFIHPFVDGNGRLHRYIIHHVLSKNNFTPQGIIFPVSASILQYIDTYRKVLEQYSHGILPFIQWKTTADKNVEVTNDTADFYKYYDATKQAEFLFDCIQDTIDIIIPQEVKYLLQYDEFKNYVDNVFEMPDKMVALLVKLLSQNNGKLSAKKRISEFPSLTDNEVEQIEEQFKNAFEE
jgi:Fic family protein